jgi:Tol biopolymer transport system component
MGSERTIVLYEFDTGRTKDLVHGAVRQPFWSPDDSRIAYLQAQDQKWRIFSFLANAPETPTPLYASAVDALHGWADGHTVLASDAQNLYWIGDDRPQQTLALREIYGDAFHSSESDTIRLNPVNSDLLLVSSKYLAPPVNSPADAAGIFLYEIHAKRRVALTTADQWAAHGEWSRDGVQVFYTRRVSPTSSTIYRVFWDGSSVRRYQDGTDLVVGQ